MQYVKTQFVDTTSDVKWCPGADCKFIVDVPLGAVVDVYCDCGLFFCSGCAKTGHKPIGCDLLKVWEDRVTKGADNDTELWIKLNVKKCPKCGTGINKNGACMHMTCANCKHGFCWLCLQPDTDHYYCHSEEEIQMRKKKAGIQDDKEKVDLDNAEREMKRLEFYSTRYFEH